jgi:hypothetical protein
MSPYALGGTPRSVALGDELKIGGSSVTKTIILPLPARRYTVGR